MSFSIILWAYPLLPEIENLDWMVDWPEDFLTLPRGSIREADNQTGIVTTEGEGSAEVAFYLDTWTRTPEEREGVKMLLNNHFVPMNLNRGMSRDTVEFFADGTKAYRNTLLFRGVWDHGLKRMCRPS